jgi:DNA-binding transcriptional ArsR family regulator
MPRETHRRITEPEALAALSHPLRLELMNHLMASGPATASACARAVGDSPSNCSYHLRVLAGVGLVEEDSSADGRERPWRALVTGFQTAGGPLAVAVQRDQRLVREYLAGREDVPKRWREADAFSTYTLRLTPAELRELRAQLDGLIRPYIAPLRDDTPRGAALVHLGLHAFPTEP